MIESPLTVKSPAIVTLPLCCAVSPNLPKRKVPPPAAISTGTSVVSPILIPSTISDVSIDTSPAPSKSIPPALSRLRESSAVLPDVILILPIVDSMVKVPVPVCFILGSLLEKFIATQESD